MSRLALAALLALTACRMPSTSSDLARRPPRMTDEQVKNALIGPMPDMATMRPLIEEAVRRTLRDPESARFRWSDDPKFFRLTYWQGWNEVVAWAAGFEVNAKNGYGGYTGFETMFAFVRDGKIERVETLKETIMGP